ncbi:MAG: RNA polymerase sigma factor (sigma-70 family) [Myxococcota bacterium]
MTQHQRALTTYASRLLRGDVERARDVVQETFLRLWQAERAGIEDHLAAWLYTVCRNRALDVRKKESRMQPIEHPRPAVAAGTPYTHADQKERTGLALQAIGHLPERQQELVRLKFQGGLSYREIADVTGLSVSNVGYVLHVALKSVREQLRSQR